jgi:hypothetical protein
MSYHIQIAEGFRVRFPSRSAEFAEGVEIGVLTTLLDMGLVEFNRVISVAARRQAIALADALGYSGTEGPVTEGLVSITFRQKGYTAAPEKKRPSFLKLVHTSD